MSRFVWISNARLPIQPSANRVWTVPLLSRNDQGSGSTRSKLTHVPPPDWPPR